MSRGKFWTGLALLVLTGCTPVISQDALKSVDRTILFEDLVRHPEDYRARNVLLGGQILETRPLTDRTRIMVLQRPLNARGRPMREEESKGRFLITAMGFLDPAIYKEGRLITVMGTVKGKVALPLGEISYTYPLVLQREMHLWAPEDTGTYPRFHFGFGLGTTL